MDDPIPIKIEKLYVVTQMIMNDSRMAESVMYKV